MTSHARHPLSERAMQIAERSFPEHAAMSGHKAYRATLKLTGAVVVKTSQGRIVERRADGTSVFIKNMPMGKRVKPGLILKRDKQST
jgi:protein PhnA